MTKKSSSELLLAPPRIQHRVSRRTLSAYPAFHRYSIDLINSHVVLMMVWPTSILVDGFATPATRDCV